MRMENNLLFTCRCSSLNVSVEILDENDNSPMFLQDSYDITLSEDHEIGTEIIRMNAFDNDSQNTPANRENKVKFCDGID